MNSSRRPLNPWRSLHPLHYGCDAAQLSSAVELVTTFLAVAGDGVLPRGPVAARVFLAARRVPLATFTPGVSILKSLKGLDPRNAGSVSQPLQANLCG